MKGEENMTLEWYHFFFSSKTSFFFITATDVLKATFFRLLTQLHCHYCNRMLNGYCKKELEFSLYPNQD